MRSKVFKNIKLYLVCLLVATAFAAIYSTSTTPLMKDNWGCDSAFFILVGQGMTKGLLPYRDFFDMKGPFLFFLEFIGQMISYGRTGAFIIQCINLSVCLYIIGKTSDMFSYRLIWLHRLVAFLPALTVAVMTFEGGNLTEEFCLPVILLSLYFCLRYFKETEITHEYKHPVMYSLFYGAAVGYICFIRITNAATIGAVLVTVFLLLLKKREFKNAALNIVMTVLGFCATGLIPCLFFNSKKMLAAMFNQVFVFGVKYSSETGFAVKLLNVFMTYKFLLVLLLLPLAASIIYREKWHMKCLSLFSGLLLLVAVTMGNAYTHYFMLFIPHVVLGVYIAYKNGGKVLKVRKNIICIICFAVMFSLSAVRIVKSTAKGAFTIYAYATENSESPALEKITDKLRTIPAAADYLPEANKNPYALDIASHIPERERGSVFGFGDVYWSRWYGVTGTMPAYKYMDWQPHYIELMPEVEKETASWVRNDGSLWIVVPAKDEPISDMVYEAIESNYYVEYTNEEYKLYRRAG
ncbi:MAG: hypothetical protein IKH20_02335 [Clostridiales bacterium]|nr:hypothetical protein [Clostridiales bacterium]